jgi:nucleoside-diphosphate-sugar epimerase
VRNVVEGLVKAAEQGRPGEIYFLTDGKPVILREFLCRLMATRGVDGNSVGNLPLFLAKFGSWIGAAPPSVSQLFGMECTVSDAKARKEIGYTGEVSVEAGIQELEEEWKQQQGQK